ncbi:MAG TPA: Yip1 family protein [Rhodanobacteraceae bacterium]|nr:Yip1 family protein [Rhodanobacteraceae bacterium]
MDITKLVARVKAILANPKSEWPAVAAEPDTIKGLYLGYIMILAAIPPVFAFIKTSLIGYGAFGVHFRTGIGAGIGSLIVAWILALIGVYVVALIVNALATAFGGQANQIQALKVVAYSYTASWIAGIGNIIPWIGWLIMIAGLIYSIYLLYLGLPETMHCPREKSAGYTAVTIICSIIVYIIIGVIVGSIFGIGMFNHPMAGTDNGGSAQVSFDKNSTLGKLQAFGQQMEKAEKSGATSVVALSPDQLKAFVPAQLNGLQRSNLSASRSGIAGLQTSEATADYADKSGHNLHLEITDTGSAKAMLVLGKLAGNVEQQSDHGYARTWHQDGNLMQEEWDNQNHSGEYSTTVADRFAVKVQGNPDSMDDLKRAVASVDLKGLAALKDQGVGK